MPGFKVFIKVFMGFQLDGQPILLGILFSIHQSYI